MKAINIKGKLLSLESPIIMGIVNITPDSFYVNSRAHSEKDIIERVHQIIDEGGTIIDIGAQSSNPKSPFLEQEEEKKRLAFALDVIRREFKSNLIISVDTFYADIAKYCVLECGVDIINDISGGQIDKEMFPTISQLNVPYILMHMRGTPQTMQSLTHYENFIPEVFYFFSEKIAQLNQLGVKDIIIDPGFGFSKTTDQNFELMGALKGFSIFEEPLLVGISRKSMIYKTLDTDAENSLNGTTVLNTYAINNGANILRVHDVKACKEAIVLSQAINKYQM